jgi:hypothetical protein
MPRLTRLDFVKSSAGAAAALAVGGPVAVADAKAAGHAEADAEPVDGDAVVAYVRDPRAGVISVMSGEREVTLKDRALAAKLARAAKRPTE